MGKSTHVGSTPAYGQEKDCEVNVDDLEEEDLCDADSFSMPDELNYDFQSKSQSTPNKCVLSIDQQ